ncbi:MAG: HAD family hydrolase [Chloroflexi bacterium]|nr:MAG: HAD family hydrolase [Chloroflexota bacterium]TMG21448.1 MAG: HAD family hydrolase [Chloroflexota bacterium]
MPVRVVGFDGDDTLWHSETRFHVTQGEFHELLERHVPEADADRRLAEMELKNLGIYGYGVKSFTLSMLETAIELTEGQIPASDLKVILGWGKRMLMEPTELLEGVEETLHKLSPSYDLLLITKGDLFDQESKLAQSGLGDLFLGVEILTEKNVDSYRGVFRRRSIQPEDFVMVGNSLRSDVVPVVSLGGHAVHIPYEVTWDHEHVPEEEMPKGGWRRIASIRELPGLLEEL